VIGVILVVTLGVHGLLVLAGAASTLRSPERASQMLAGKADGSSGTAALVAVYLVPFQLVVSALLFRTAYELARELGGAGHAVFMLCAFTAMELGFVVVRIRSGVARGAALVISAVFALVYASGALLIGLAD
jgi:hypothetical protein